MTKKTKLQNLLNRLSGNDETTLAGFKAFDEGVAKLKADLKETIKVSTLNDVNTELDNFRKKIDLDPLLEAVDTLQTEFRDEIDRLSEHLDQRVSELVADADGAEESNDITHSELIDAIDGVREQIANVVSDHTNKLNELESQWRESDRVSDSLTDTKIAGVDLKILEVDKKVVLNKNETDVALGEADKKTDKLRVDLVSMIANKGGGNQNRQILIGGVDPLKRYTDINLKAGNNVTITYVNNDQTKKVDVTIASSGGGGGGTVRSINSISLDTIAGATAGTDYVYLVSGTTTLTLPTSVGNTNLYTVKNVGTGVVTVATTSAQTIDNDSSVTMPVRYTSIDLISDTSNWSIT